MNTHPNSRGSPSGYISVQLAIVLAVIVGGAGILAYEWHAAHPGKHHDGGGSIGHHHHKHAAQTAANE